MNRQLPFLALSLLAPCFQSCATDRFGEVEERVTVLGGTLEAGALELQTIGPAHALLATDPLRRYAAAAEVLAELQREAHRYFQARKDVADRADGLTKSLAAAGSSSATCLEQVRAIQADMQAEHDDLDEFGEDIKARIQLVSEIQKQLVAARTPVKGEPLETVEQLFSRLESEFPHWKGDIAHIRKKHGDQLVALTTGCDAGSGADCDPLALLDPERSMRRLQSYQELVSGLEKEWGKEIATELRGYVLRHPEGLLLDVVTVSSNHAQVLRALHVKLGWVGQALDELGPATKDAGAPPTP